MSPLSLVGDIHLQTTLLTPSPSLPSSTMRTFALTAILLPMSLATHFSPCPLLGPVFPPASGLCAASSFQNALRNLTTTLDYSTKTGETRYGVYPSNSSSFSIGVFDAATPGGLFSYQYSSPELQNGTEGTKHVSEDSIYRVGSLSKLITIYLFLIEAGSKYWNHPITEFVSQLADATRNCSAIKNAVDCVDWNEVTLGALASHMAGIPRDCKWDSYAGLAGVQLTNLNQTQRLQSF